MLGTPAVKIGVQIDGPAVQSRCHGQYFKSGAGLIAVGDHPIAPLLQPGSGEGIVISSFAFRIGFAVLRLAQIVLPELFQLRCGVLVENLLIAVGIVAAQCRHGQDLPGLDIHHDAEGTVLDIVAVNGGGQRLADGLVGESGPVKIGQDCPENIGKLYRFVRFFQEFQIRKRNRRRIHSTAGQAG